MDMRKTSYVTLSVCSLGAAALHFAELGTHWREYWIYGVFFAVMAWFQAVWAALVVHRPSRMVLLVGVIGNASVAVVWLLSRTIGVGIGPAAGGESIARTDALATALALVVALGGTVLLATERRGPLVTRAAWTALGVVAVLLVVSVTVTIGTSDTDAHSGAHDQAAAAGVHHRDGSPADGEDDITSREQAAARLLRTTEAAVAQYADVDVARAAGFRPNPNQLGALVHYPNFANRRDSAVLDPERPEGLVYYRTPAGELRLVGALYTAGAGALPPSPGGDLTRWHSHTPGCEHPAEVPACADQVRLYMLHVWLVDRVVNPFADTLRGALAAGVGSQSEASGHRHAHV